MMKKRGFTLIELLVVIAIIALLMSILAPALTRVRAQAKNALCMSRLHQWAAIFAMYADNDDGQLTGWGDLSPGDETYAAPDVSVDFHEHCWVPRLRKYYAEEMKWRLAQIVQPGKGIAGVDGKSVQAGGEWKS